MSQQLISRSPDLLRLRDDGYEVDVKGGYLVLTHVPYVNSSREIKYGMLVSTLTLAGEVTATPDTHVAFFGGDHPCDKNGDKLRRIEHTSGRQTLHDGVVVDHSFSAKLKKDGREGYTDYYEKMTTYVAAISGPAEALDPDVTARTRRVVASEEADSVFEYTDTASSRAKINLISKKLELSRIAIVGAGGTGSYVVDLVSKTPVREIHLYDKDLFLQHNAFRAPGAASLSELRERPSKVAYLKSRYSNMHRGIVAHEHAIGAANVGLLDGMDFIFLCLDQGRAKRAIIEHLEARGTPFVDVGMGLFALDEALAGVVRVTTSTDANRVLSRDKERIQFGDADEDDEYATNVQIADLNALNAALAVIRWKKVFKFYLDLEREHHSTYTVDGNVLTNEDRP